MKKTGCNFDTFGMDREDWMQFCMIRQWIKKDTCNFCGTGFTWYIVELEGQIRPKRSKQCLHEKKIAKRKLKELNLNLKEDWILSWRFRMQIIRVDAWVVSNANKMKVKENETDANRFWMDKKGDWMQNRGTSRERRRNKYFLREFEKKKRITCFLNEIRGMGHWWKRIQRPGVIFLGIIRGLVASYFALKGIGRD